MRRMGLGALLLAILAACGTLAGADDTSEPTADAAVDAPADALVEAEKEASPTTDSGDAGTDVCITCVRTIFVTNDTVLATGVKDDTCNTAAGASVHKNVKGKTFHAWYSTEVPARARLTQGTGNYLLPSGAVVADNFQELVTTGPKVPIREDENGDAFSDPSLLVWTGTLQNGTTSRAPDGAAFDCAGWTINDVGTLGTIGRYTETGPNWTFYGEAVCTSPARLYCIED